MLFRSKMLSIVVILLALVSFTLAGTINVRYGPSNEEYPRVIQIKPTDCITWHNNGKGVHIVQSLDGSFDSGIIRVGDSFTHCFIARGVFEYIDGVKGDEKSLVVVGDLPFTPPERYPEGHPLPATPEPEIRPVQRTTPPTNPPGVQLTATDVSVAASNDNALNEISAASARNVVVQAAVVGTRGSLQAYALLSDGCNTVRSPTQPVAAGSVATFDAIDARSLLPGDITLSVVLGTQEVPGSAVTKAEETDVSDGKQIGRAHV